MRFLVCPPPLQNPGYAYVFHTGNFLSFHTRNLPFYIPFQTEIFFHILFHTSTPRYVSTGRKRNLYFTFATLSVRLKVGLVQKPETFWTSGPHSVLARFQPAATIPADQTRKVFARNSGSFADESMAKTKKKWPFFSDKLVAEFTKQDFRHGMIIISAVYCCISVIEKRKKVADWMAIKGRGPCKMPWRAEGCRLLA